MATITRLDVYSRTVAQGVWRLAIRHDLRPNEVLDIPLPLVRGTASEVRISCATVDVPDPTPAVDDGPHIYDFDNGLSLDDWGFLANALDSVATHYLRDISTQPESTQAIFARLSKRAERMAAAIRAGLDDDE